MTDNGLKIVFDYRKPDQAVLITYKVWGGGMFTGTDPSISIVKTFTGAEAIALYSELSGKSIEQIKKEESGEYE